MRRAPGRWPSPATSTRACGPARRARRCPPRWKASSVPRSGCGAPWQASSPAPGSAGPGTLVLSHVDWLSEPAAAALGDILDLVQDPLPLVISTVTPGERSVSGPLEDRLRTQVVAVPPLRGRPEDIAGIAEVLIRRHASGPTAPRIVPNALRLLMRHEWPGNVRELEALIIRVVADGRAHDITPTDLAELGSGSPFGRSLGNLEALEREAIIRRCATRRRTRHEPLSRWGCPVPPCTGRSPTTASTPTGSCSADPGPRTKMGRSRRCRGDLTSGHESPSHVARDQARRPRIAGAPDPGEPGRRRRATRRAGQRGHRRRQLRRRAPPSRRYWPRSPRCLSARPRRSGTPISCGSAPS